MLALLQDLALEAAEMPAALAELKEWSVWMVGLQTGTLALITFISGEKGFLKFTNTVARWAVYLALFFFAVSIFFATWVLGAIPSIRVRLPTAGGESDYWSFVEALGICANAPDPSATGNFFCMPALDNVAVPVVVLASAEHWAFVVGIALFVLALGIEKVRDKPAKPKSVEGRLRDLKALRDKSLITSEEYRSRKDAILNDEVAV